MQAAVARVWYYLQRFVSERVGLLAVLAAVGLLQRNEYAEMQLQRESWLQISTCAILVLCLFWRLLVGRTTKRSASQSQLDRLELGLLVLANVYVAIQLSGGAASWAQPLAYVAVAYLVGFNTRALGMLLTLCAVGFQLLIYVAGAEGRVDWLDATVRVGYLLLFALANWLFLQVEVVRRRQQHDQRLAREISHIQQEARDFRLISSALSDRSGTRRAEEEAKLARGAVETIHQGMFLVLNLLKRALDLQTCVLLWLDAGGQELRVKEMVTDSDMVSETPIPAQAGALGGIVKNRLLLNLRRPRQAAQSLPYYAGYEQVGAFAGVPVLEDGHLRGVLCADRRSDQPFDEQEEKVLVDATRQVLCAIQTERVLAAVERSKYEHERFYRASTMLNNALTLAQVQETAFAAAREITEFDFAAVTLYDSDSHKHTISRVHCAEAGNWRARAGQLTRLEGQQFRNNAGLVSMVVKNRHFLPAGEGRRETETTVFTRKLRLPAARSLVVLPLVAQDQAIGSFVLASQAARCFPKQTREMLGVICNQVAVAIENAKMYRRMEELATTDGLTELPNHRTFQARFSEMLHRAERHAKPVSLVLTDVDRFKSINDTYGHPVGDQVLKVVASILAEQARKVDIVARYGGEEFAIVLEETDAGGAMLLCERIRQQIAARLMNSDKGGFRVTISLGIASYPQDGKEKQLLIERADQALYRAKQTGRNRTVRYGQLRKSVESAAG
jgi:two-component system cell cycle response regulator